MNKSNKEKLTSKGIPKNAPGDPPSRRRQSIIVLRQEGQFRNVPEKRVRIETLALRIRTKNKEHYEENLIDNKRSKDILNHYTNKENLPSVVDEDVHISDTDEPKIVVNCILFTLDTKEQEDSCQTNNKEMDAKDPEKKRRM